MAKPGLADTQQQSSNHAVIDIPIVDGKVSVEQQVEIHGRNPTDYL